MKSLLKAMDIAIVLGVLILGFIFTMAFYYHFFPPTYSSDQQAMIEAGRKVYKSYNCEICHGKTGARPIDRSYPKIASQNAAYTARQIRGFRSGARNNALSSIMRAQVEAMSDDEIEKVALYLESQ